MSSGFTRPVAIRSAKELTAMVLPLEGVRVLAIEQYGAGPFGTQFLADQGAEVIKVENPAMGGDYARNVGPYFFTEEHSQFFHAFNRNKKSLTLDITSDQGRAVFHDLVKTADAVASNARGDVPAKLGITYADLKTVNPGIVCAHLSAYGREGSRATWPGFDFLMQAEAGYFSLTGEPGTPPARMGLSIVDLMTGLGLAYSVAIGILKARETGIGRDLDVSLFDMALANLAYAGVWYLNAGHVQSREPRSGHPSLVPCALYTTKDGWIYLMCNKEKFWPALCNAIGREEWAQDPRFATFKDRLAHRDMIQDLLDQELQAKTTAEWMELFAGRVPAAPLHDIKGALDNPFVEEQQRIQNVEIEGHGEARLIATPIRTGDPAPARAAPTLGQHTDELLRDIGYDDARLARLRDEGVI
jgi:crotonobetainyl-CoA:carnitine CoA-transferase CaiB-like acyl-CoA transferase